MNIQSFRFTIIGTGAGLMTHNPAGMSTTAGDQITGKKKVYDPRTEAEAGLYRDGGKLCFPYVAIRNATLAACKGKKFGKVSALSRVAPALAGKEELIPILHASTMKPFRDEDWVIDSRRVIIQRNGVIHHRPKFLNWAAKFEMSIDVDIVAEGEIVKLMNEAGTSIGIGDYRPQKSGWFGTFTAEMK